MHARLTGELAHLGVPPPWPDVVEEVRTEAPVPFLAAAHGETSARRLVLAVAQAWRRSDNRSGGAETSSTMAFLCAFRALRTSGRQVEGHRVIVRRARQGPRACGHQRLLAEGFLAAARPPGLKGNDGIVLASQAGSLDWPSFLHRTLPVLQSDGWRVDIDASFRPEVVESDGDWQLDLSQEGAWWFSLDLGIEVAGERVSLLPHPCTCCTSCGTRRRPMPSIIWSRTASSICNWPMASPGASAGRVRAILGTLIELNDANALRDDGRLDVSLGHAAALAGLEASLQARWLGGKQLREMADRLKGFDGLERVPVPTGFAAELRP